MTDVLKRRWSYEERETGRISCDKKAETGVVQLQNKEQPKAAGKQTEVRSQGRLPL